MLERALHEKIDSNLERIFRLLGLRYAQSDIHSAYIGITGHDRRLRANAVEFLDNVLKKEVKRYLFPIVDNIPDDFKVRRGHELFGLSFASREEGMRHLVEGPDPWLASCAIHALGSSASPALRTAIEARKDDPNPVVRETARRALACARTL